MKKRKGFMVAVMLLAIVFLGIGYATISNISLNLNGTANVKANADFSVKYDVVGNFKGTIAEINMGTTETPDNHNAIEFVRVDDTNVNLTFYLDSTTRSAYAILPVLNVSTDINAKISEPIVTQIAGDNADYFNNIEAKIYSNEECTQEITYSTGSNPTEILKQSGIVYLKVSISLAKLPAEDITSSNTFNVKFDAIPVDTAA